MTNYILRRNNWGEESCANLKAAAPEFVVVNKDVDVFPENAKWCVRWGTTSSIPNASTVKVINKAQAIHTVYNKASFRKLMADEGLAPETVVNEIPEGQHSIYPAILRPTKHYGSNDLYCVYNQTQAKMYVQEIKDELGIDYEGYYLSKFIDKDREFRVFVVSGRVVATLEKMPTETDKAENVSWGVDYEGGAQWKYINWNHWPIQCVKSACAAFKLSSLDFGAVDMIMKGQNAYCLEINTAPLISPYYAGQFMKGIKWIIDKDDRSFIDPGPVSFANGVSTTLTPENNYHSYIHPALEV